VQNYKDIFDRLINGLILIYGSNLQSVVLYGSVARGVDTVESDIDIAVFVTADSEKMHDDMTDLNVDLELECGKVISILLIDEVEYMKWNKVSPFYKNVKNEGVVLWKAA
jgi:predicted nucleotidyltransferase